ncbi:MAG: hypothetical protein WDA47_00285, partial [Bacilli bacterium]
GFGRRCLGIMRHPNAIGNCYLIYGAPRNGKVLGMKKDNLAFNIFRQCGNITQRQINKRGIGT